MPFTRLQHQQRIQQNLNDITGTWFDQPAVLDSMQDGYDEILCDTQCYEGTASITFANGNLYYDLYNLQSSPSFMRPVRLFNQNTRRWIPITDTRSLDKFRLNWEATGGSPWWGVIVNHQYLTFFPHYVAGAGLSFDLFYKICPDPLLDDDQIIQIPDSYEKVLENYCTADLLESMGEPKKAAGYWIDYQEDVGDLKIRVATRMLPDLSYQLDDLT